jgi:hypothetical protein
MSYIVTRPAKSRGIAALLILIFGPLGMLYSTIIGAFIMTFVAIPIIVFVGLKSSVFLLIILPFYYIGCFVWTIRAVNNYNRKIIREASDYNNKMSNQLIDSNIKSKYNLQEKDELRYDIKRLKILYDTNVIDGNKYETQKDNIEKKIYYLENGKDYQQTYPSQEVLSEKKTSILPLLFIFLVIFLIACILYDSKTNSFKIDKITSIFSVQQSKEKEEIKRQLEKTYFDVFNGKYTAQNFTGGVEIPFYNTNINTLVVMGLGPLATFTGNLKVEPYDIDVYDINRDDNSAKIKYNIKVVTKKGTVNGSIDMDVKKIGGVWKFDAEKFFGNFENSGSNKLKNNANDNITKQVVERPLFQITDKIFYDIYNGSKKYKRIIDIDEINNLLTPELKNQLIENSSSFTNNYKFFDLGEVRYKEFKLHFFVYNYIGGMGDYQNA